MILRIFGVFDEKAAAFMKPFFLPTRGVAVRAFTDAVVDDKEQFSKHPADYTLYELGEFHQGTGEFKSSKQVIGNATTFIENGGRS